MTNDLTSFEKDLLKSINFSNGTKYNYKNLMEWGCDKKAIESNQKPDEVIYEALGCYVAIKKLSK